MLSRRAFLGSSAAFAAQLFAAPADSKKPGDDLEKLAAAALREAKKLKASYCDIRIARYRDQSVSIRMTPERGTGKTLEVPGVVEDSSFGFGVRVIANGAWGFASSPIVTPTRLPASLARRSLSRRRIRRCNPKPVQLAPVKAYRDRWVSPHEKDPFTVPIGEKLELLRSVAAEMKKNQRVFGSNASLMFRSEDKYFASSEGSSIQQLVIQTYGNAGANAVDRQAGVSRTRTYTPRRCRLGWEYVPEMNLLENAQRVREEVIEHLSAPPVKPGSERPDPAAEPSLSHDS